jgi:pyrroloquinoline quinone biosynthesis protein E
MSAAPQALIAELTHRCPLHCVYCSNPVQMQGASHELATNDWISIIRQAGELSCWHLHLTGGEPLLRRDAEQLVRAGRESGLYVNLVTSGFGLTRDRLRALVEAGLDHIQLSFQDTEELSANIVAGTKAHAQKLRVAGWIREHQIAFTVNVVVHRHNIDRLEDVVRFAEQLKADKLEIANVQYYGWALPNQAALLPSREQLRSSLPVIEAARARLGGNMRIDYVLPDYYAKYPKPCMGGWGRNMMLIDPSGRAMPCHSAGVIPSLEFPNAAEVSLRAIWDESAAFTQFRGESWMQEPCRSCERRAIDFGGCRCQAMLLARDAAATDPVCSRSPMRFLVDDLVQKAALQGNEAPQWVYRIDPVR